VCVVVTYILESSHLWLGLGGGETVGTVGATTDYQSGKSAKLEENNPFFQIRRLPPN